MSEENETLHNIDVTRIMEMLPHRYPILLIDRFIEMVPGERAIALKNVTFNEPHFQGHFPQMPVMPGVLIVEAMAQAAGATVVQSLGEGSEGNVVYFMTIDNARFRKPVVPGDSLYIHVEKLQGRRNVWKFKGEAKVNDVVHAEATFSAMITDQTI